MTGAETLALLKRGKLKGASRLDLSADLKEIPGEVYDLADSLEILNLSGNRLSDLPEDLTRLKKLRILFCSQNQFEHLPPVAGKLPALEMLGFKSNRIEVVDETSLSPSLRWLILTDNRISRLPSSVGACLPLRKLMLSGNRLRELPDEMAACVNLELIRLAANRFEELPEWLFGLPKLAWFAFSGNPVSAHARGSSFPGATLHWEHLDLGDKLGEGASGTIHRALHGSREIAVKIFKGEVTSDGIPASEMAAVLAAGEHPHLIRPLGPVEGHPSGSAALAMELIGGDFKNLANPPSLESCTRDVYPLDLSFCMASAIRIARGMAAVSAALHERGLMHGDLYAHNMLIDAGGHCLLGDFGAATFHPPHFPAGLLEKIEVRAFGCLLEELLERVDGREIPESLQAIATPCLNIDPGSRPSFHEIVQMLEDAALALGLPSGGV
jgi:hypothetical protein